MDPARAFNDESLKLIGQSYETLYQYHYLKRPYEIVPLLADSMPELSKNGKIYRIHIRKGVKYHPHPAFEGKDRFVTSQDFVNQIKRLAFKPVKSLGTWLFEGRLLDFDDYTNRVGESFEKMLSDNIKGVRAINEHTLELEFLKKEPIILNFLTMNFVTPLPQEVIVYEKNNFDNVMVGTGPFLLTERTDSSFVLTAFKDYRKDFYPSVGDRYANRENLISSSNQQIPFVNKINFTVIKDEEDRMQAFIEHKIDFINLPKKYVSSFVVLHGDLTQKLKKQKIVLKHFASISSDWISFNMKDPILGKNKELREAIAYAINYDDYTSVVTKGANRRANSIYNPGIPGYNPRKSLPFKFDLKKARELMKKAGYPEGRGLPPITYSTRSDTGIHLEVGDFIKKNLAEIGIKVNVEILKFSEFLKKGRAGELQLFLDRWIYDYPDAENLIQLLITKNHPGINKSGFSNSDLDKLYYQYVQEADEERKVRLMGEIEKIVFQEVPWIMLTYYSSYILHYKNIKNYRKSSFIRNHLKYIKKE